MKESIEEFMTAFKLATNTNTSKDDNGKRDHSEYKLIDADAGIGKSGLEKCNSMVRSGVDKYGLDLQDYATENLLKDAITEHNKAAKGDKEESEGNEGGSEEQAIETQLANALRLLESLHMGGTANLIRLQMKETSEEKRGAINSKIAALVSAV
jgi:hypothetical protein